MGVLDIVKPGIVTGGDAKKMLDFETEKNFALPAVNVVGSSSVNGVIEADEALVAPEVTEPKPEVAEE